MANIDQTWQNKIVPQIVGQARPVADLLMALHAEKDFDSACKNLGYRSQEENPCIFYVQVEGKISNLDTASRSGKMTIADKSGNSIIVQIGPTLRGTQLRDAFKGTSYSDFNDQVLFGEYGRGINEQAIKMIQLSLKPENQYTFMVFLEWEIPKSIPVITPAKIESVGGQ